MHWFLLGALLTQLAACSKTVTWEEDVVLDSGKALRVQRFDGYVLAGGENANPFQMGWWLKHRAIKLRWHSRENEFTAPTTDILMIQEIGEPAQLGIVAWTAECQTPGYGEYRWDGREWRLQSSVNAHLLGRRRNLMHHYTAEQREMPKLVTPEFRLSEDTQSNRGRIDPVLMASRLARSCP